jgi:transcription elongation factor SPT6
MKERYIDGAKSIEDLKNMELYIKFQKELNEEKIIEIKKVKKGLENEINNSQTFNYIPPIQYSLVKKAVKNKLNEYSSKFALSARDFAFNLELILNDPDIDNSKLIPTPTNPSELPSQLASKYLSDDLQQVLNVMKSVCIFLSHEIESHPFLRQYIWQHFKNNCYLSTEPTELGQKDIDIFSRAFRTKRLNKKPINSFNNDLYLDIIQAEKKGLIKVKIEINISDSEYDKIKAPLKKAYMPNSDENNNNDEESQWRIMRDEVIRIFIGERMQNQFKEEIRKELEKNAEEYVIEQCGNAFMDLLMSGPYRKRIVDNNDDEKLFKDNNLPRVLSFVFNNNNNITYAVMLNKNGEVIDHFNFNYFHQKYFSKTDDECKKEQNTIKNIIDQQKPDLIIIGANDLKCRYLKENINQHFMEKNKFWVTYGDLSIPRIYANSIYGDNSFPKYNLYLRQAVSLGRYQQNPLEEILQLWNENRNKNYCLKINLHPLQNEVNQSKLIEKLEYKAIEVVNSIGVDINKAFEFIHLRNTLMFVSGLGPRKAQYIIEKISPQNGLVSRIELSIRKIIGPIIRTCCTPFIKIKTDITNANNDNKKFNLLDMTRIPLDQYPAANNIIAFVLEEKLNDKESNQSQIEEIIKNPTKLEIIDDNKYFINNSNNQNINIKELKFYFKLIVKELYNPYSDPRKQRKDLIDEQIFPLLIGDENFKEGQITVAKVIKVDQQHVKCRLMNGLEATLWIKHIFEENEIGTYEEMKERYKEGTVFEARIKEINYIKFKVDLETRPSSMRDHSKYLKSDQLDPYFNYIPDEDTKNLKYIENSKQQHHKYIPRNITMEKFRNVGYLGVKEILRNKEIGECIFRPSSRGHDHLTLSWKFYKFIIAHVDIIEHDKLPGASIGSRLQIGDDYYSSLNEIIERYVNACANLVRNAIQNRKFINCEKVSEFENKLKEEKQKSLSIINYHFTILPEFPSYIVLGYVPKVNPVLEYIKVKPKGLYFHNRYSNDLDSIISFFKSNYGSESYYDFVRKVRPPTIEYYRNIENDYGRRDDNNDNVIVQNTDNSYNRNRPETRTCNICHI